MKGHSQTKRGLGCLTVIDIYIYIYIYNVKTRNNTLINTHNIATNQILFNIYVGTMFSADIGDVFQF